MRCLALVALVLLALLLLVVGCKKPAVQPSPSAPSAMTGTLKAFAPPSTPPPSTESVPEPKTVAAPVAKAEPPKFPWKDAPTLADVPNEPVCGIIDGVAFKPVSVVIDWVPGLGFRGIEFTDRKLVRDTDWLANETGVTLYLDKDLKKGLQRSTKMTDPGPACRAEMGFANPAGKRRIVQPPAALAIAIDSGDVMPHERGGSVVQVAGKVSGRIYLCWDDGEQSRIAGTFEALARYRGEPQ